MRSLLVGLALLLSASAWAQSAPSGSSMLNQAIAAKAVVKSDTTVLIVTRGLYVGDATTCNLAVVLQEDQALGRAAVTLSNVQPGTFLPLQVAKVMSTNTTCTLVVGLW